MNLRYVISLVTANNDYQLAQRDAAEAVAQRLGVQVEFMYADNDAVLQTQQILSVVQRKNDRPAGVICAAVGSGMPQVAQAAAAAGVGWAIVNRDVDYLDHLRQQYGVAAFSVLVDNVAIGRIMGQQAAALLPKGGSVVYLTGPSSGNVSQMRLSGFLSSKPANITVCTTHGQWTKESGFRAISSFLSLSTTKTMKLDLVICQNDDMAEGARQAFAQAGSQWPNLRFTGVDGLPDTGQAMVQQGNLAATVLVPTMANLALEALVAAARGGPMAETHILISPVSYPPVENLVKIPS